MSRYLSGLPAWLVQRISAVYLAAFIPLVMLWWWFASPLEYAQWRAVFAHPAGVVAIGLFLVALLSHTWVGVRDIVLDYLGQRPNWCLFALVLLGGWLLALGIWALRILVGVWA